MITVLTIITFLIIRMYYQDLYVIVFYLSLPFIFIMMFLTSSGNLAAAEEMGNAVFLTFVLLVIEVLISRFGNKTVTKKKKR